MPVLNRTFPEESGGRWNRLLPEGESEKRVLDLKKPLIFPIVTVRGLALAGIDTGRKVSDGVAEPGLSSVERDLLKDAMAVDKRFKSRCGRSSVCIDDAVMAGLAFVKLGYLASHPPAARQQGGVQ